jgi:hypothetical protein
MFYEREIDIPFDVLDIDGFAYLVPHGLPVKVEPLLDVGVENVSLLNRNVTVIPVETTGNCEYLNCHPLISTDDIPVIFRSKIRWYQVLNLALGILGMT